MTALEHFEKLLEFETDCWDVHEDLKSGKPNYVILDVRGPEAYAAGHVPGAINLPRGRIVERSLAAFPAGVAFVVWGASRGGIGMGSSWNKKSGNWQLGRQQDWNPGD